MAYCPAKVTVVVPTYNRWHAVTRNLRQWAGMSAEFIILDNGRHNEATQRARSMPKNATYHHDPDGFTVQMANLSQHIRTPYAILCDDDNILLESGLRACVSLLEQNPRVNFAWGTSATFQEVAGFYHLTRTYWRPCSAPESFEAGLQAVDSHMRQYTPLAWYAVHRSESFVRHHEMVSRVRTLSSTAYATEIAFEFASFFDGCGVGLDALTVLRSLNERPLNQHTPSRILTINQWLHQPQYNLEVASVGKAIAESLDVRPEERPSGSQVVQLLRFHFPEHSHGGISMSVNSLVYGIPFWPKSNRVLNAFLRSGSRIRGSIAWWFSSKAPGQLQCQLQRLFGQRSRRILLDRSMASLSLSDQVELQKVLSDY